MSYGALYMEISINYLTWNCGQIHVLPFPSILVFIVCIFSQYSALCLRLRLLSRGCGRLGQSHEHWLKLKQIEKKNMIKIPPQLTNCRHKSVIIWKLIWRLPGTSRDIQSTYCHACDIIQQAARLSLLQKKQQQKTQPFTRVRMMTFRKPSTATVLSPISACEIGPDV